MKFKDLKNKILSEHNDYPPEYDILDDDTKKLPPHVYVSYDSDYYVGWDKYDTVEFIDWENGTWEDGDYPGGNWYNGTFEDGVWEDGTWYNGTFKKGDWNDGIFKGGTFKGTWFYGEFLGGTFAGKVWEDGVWSGEESKKSPIWKGKKWKTGWIYDPKQKGNFEPDWEWDDLFVKSPIDPKKYWKGKEKFMP